MFSRAVSCGISYKGYIVLNGRMIVNYERRRERMEIFIVSIKVLSESLPEGTNETRTGGLRAKYVSQNFRIGGGISVAILPWQSAK
jgi:hypothetical protein